MSLSRKLVKHARYASYIARHKFYVLIECCKLGIPLRGMLHDLSKLYPDEWGPYADYTFGELAERDCASFDRAFLRHQHRNPHHVQHWQLKLDDGRELLLPMPEEYVRECLADWRGAGKAKEKDDICDWLRKNAGCVEVSPATEMRLVRLRSPP